MALILVYVRKTNYFEKRESFYPELNGPPLWGANWIRDVKIESNCCLMTAMHDTGFSWRIVVIFLVSCELGRISIDQTALLLFVLGTNYAN